MNERGLCDIFSVSWVNGSQCGHSQRDTLRFVPQKLRSQLGPQFTITRLWDKRIYIPAYVAFDKAVFTGVRIRNKFRVHWRAHVRRSALECTCVQLGIQLRSQMHNFFCDSAMRRSRTQTQLLCAQERTTRGRHVRSTDLGEMCAQNEQMRAHLCLFIFSPYGTGYIRQDLGGLCDELERQFQVELPVRTARSVPDPH